jgi:hypothetical protein
MTKIIRMLLMSTFQYFYIQKHILKILIVLHHSFPFVTFFMVIFQKVIFYKIKYVKGDRQ